MSGIEDPSLELEAESTARNGASAAGDIATETGPQDTTMASDDDFDVIGERIRQIEEEAEKIRKMQCEVEKQFNTTSSSTAGSPVAQPVLSYEEKVLIDGRSVHVANVDYNATVDQLEEHFRGCGSIDRITILLDKYNGNPKGFAYIQFTDAEGMQNALSMTDSLFLGRQIKVTSKRTNRPGISSTNRPPRGRGRARMIVKYIYPSRGGLRGTRPRRARGFSPY